MVKVGLIGCGYISKFHISGHEKAGSQIVHVCDVRLEAAQAVAAKYQAKATADYRALLADPDVQVVDIMTNTNSHREICLAAIAAGKHVICEKTLGLTAQEALEIIQAAKAKGVIFYTSYMKRFIPAVAKAKELLPSIGRIVTTHIRAHQYWGEFWKAMPTEGGCHTPAGGMSGLRKGIGGGILWAGGSHILDLTLFLLGRPHRLYGNVYTPEGRDYDLRAAALLETPSNGVVHFETMIHDLKRVGFLRDGWDERFEITGLDGRLEFYSSQWDNPNTKASLLIHYDNATGQATEYRQEPVSPFDVAIAFFCRNIERGEQGSQSIITGYEVDELISHIERSSCTSQALEVNWRL